MIAPLLAAGAIGFGIAAIVAAATALSKLLDASNDANKNFSTCPVGSPSTTCPNSIEPRNREQKQRALRSALAFNGKQVNKDTCALMSTQSILLEKDGKAPSEQEMMDIGKESGAYTPCNGTKNEATVLTAAGIPATQKKKPSLGDIATEVESGKAVIVGYDARPVWYKDKDDWPPQPLGHAVRVTGVDRNPDGSVRGFYINDSGSGKSGEYVSAQKFETALDNFGGGRMAVSNEPINPGSVGQTMPPRHTSGFDPVA